MIFVDTSAFYAFSTRMTPSTMPLEINGVYSKQNRERLCTTNYVVLETCTLLQTRLGLAPVRALRRDVLPLLEQYFIDEPFHAAHQN